MARKSSKEAILEAAERVIRRQGLAAASIEAVAREAGVSKGGLFYHFSSKKDLLLQLVDRYDEGFQKLRREVFDKLPDSPGRLLKATIIASISHPAKVGGSISNLLTLLDDVDLRERICRIKKKVFEEVAAHSRNPEKVAIALLAADGLWVTEMFGRPAFDTEFKNRIVNELLRLIDVHKDELG